MSTSTPPTWAWVEEKYVPVKTTELPLHSCNLSDSDALRERYGSDPTYRGCRPSAQYLSDSPDPTGEDVWPLERAVSTTASGAFGTDQCPECRSAPGRPHAPECGVAALITDAQINAAPEHVGPAPDSYVSEGAREHRIGTCYLDPDTGETVMPADFFGEKELRWTSSPADSFHETASFPQGENSADVKVDSCPECAALHTFRKDGLIPKRETAAVEATFDVPFKTQEFMFEELAPVQAEYLHDILNDHMELIIEMARRRFRTGYQVYGSAAYLWDAETRLTNVLEELADSVVYCTTGPIE